MAMTPEQKLFYNIAMVGGYFGGYASVRSLVLGSAQTGNLIGIVEMLLGANWMGFFIRVGASVLYAIGVCLTMIVRNHRPQDLKVYSVLLSLIGSGVFLMMPTKMDVILALYPIFFCMSFQFIGQSVFVGLGRSRSAVFFSLLRKAIINAPLTVILPIWMGTTGVFTAEAVSQLLGGMACILTMYFTVYRKLGTEAARTV